MSSSRHFSAKTKREAYARSQGRCENPSCRAPFPAGGGGVEFDHNIPWDICRDSSPENCVVLCAACHKAKTFPRDFPVIFKCKRIADRWIGIKRQKSGKKLAAGRDSPISKKLNGEVVPRPPRYGRHRATMAKRYEEFNQ